MTATMPAVHDVAADGYCLTCRTVPCRGVSARPQSAYAQQLTRIESKLNQVLRALGVDPDRPAEQPPAPRPAWLPEDDRGTVRTPDGLGFEAFGVRLATIGADGDWLALGHVEPLRMIAAIRRVGRVEMGLSDEELFGDDDRPDRRLVDELMRFTAAFTIAEPDGAWCAYFSTDAQASAEAVPVTMWRA